MGEQFHCLRCGHDVSDSDNASCPACGDPAALDPDQHPAPWREFVAEVMPSILGGEGFYRAAERGEHQRRLKAQRASARERLVGAVGKARSPLRLSGDVEVDGARYSARSGYEYIAAGESVRVVAIDGAMLVVRRVTAP